MSARTAAWTLARMVLGLAQIALGLTALYLVATRGLDPLSAGVAVAACLLTTVSVMLFGGARH